MEDTVLVKLGVSLVLGLLVGMQRERTESSLAGIRTFTLITLYGTVCGLLARQVGGWVVAAGLIALAGLFVIGNYARLKTDDIDPGLTTELAALLMFGVGAYLAVGSMSIPVVLSGAIALLLQLKKPMHRFVAAIGEKDIRAIMQFVLVTLVILPVLPNQAFGPYGSLNPFKIWLFVVLIVSLSLFGYLIYKLAGVKAGMLFGGVLGGLISSTATTVSYAKSSTETPEGMGPAALVIMIASTVLYVRLTVLIAVVAARQFVQLTMPLLVMFGAGAVIVGGAYRLVQKQSIKLLPPENPAELKSALILGALFAVISLAVATAKVRLGSTGLYVVALVSGLVQVDAVALSTAQLVNNGSLQADTGWRLILIATMSNLVFKAGIVAWRGNGTLWRQVAMLFALTMLVGGVLLWVWPLINVGG